MMNSKLIFSVALFFALGHFVGLTKASAQTAVPASAPVQAEAPAAAPFKEPSVRLAVDPWVTRVTENEFTVLWTTNMDAAAWVEVAPDDGTHWYKEDRPKFYDSYIGRRRLGKLHSVRVTGLKPGTKYRYRLMQQAVLENSGRTRVILGEGWGTPVISGKEPYSVRTLDSSKDSASFWVVNDIHERDSVFRNLMKGIDKAKLDFVVFNGDMTTQIENEGQMMDGYLRSASKTISAAGVPIFYNRGNHENRGVYADRLLDYFPTTTGECWYAFREGPVYFLMLDCGEDKPDDDIRYYGLSVSQEYREQEAEWLKKIVSSQEYKAAPLHVVIYHMVPADPKTSWYGEQQASKLFMPILNGTGVDVMLCGHYHKYSFFKAGERGDTDFPVVVNSNSDKLSVRCSYTGGKGKIDVDVVDQSGKVIHSHHFTR